MDGWMDGTMDIPRERRMDGWREAWMDDSKNSWVKTNPIWVQNGAVHSLGHFDPLQKINKNLLIQNGSFCIKHNQKMGWFQKVGAGSIFDLNGVVSRWLNSCLVGWLDAFENTSADFQWLMARMDGSKTGCGRTIQWRPHVWQYLWIDQWRTSQSWLDGQLHWHWREDRWMEERMDG